MESMEKRTILELRGLCRRINSEFYLHDIDLTLREGEVGAIVGRNASGKSTLFSVRVIVCWIGELQLRDPLFIPAHNRPFLSQSS